MARYELIRGDRTMVWVVERRGAGVFTRHGKLGDKGRSGAQMFPDDSRAMAYVDAQLQEKVESGYRLVDAEASVDAPLGPATSAKQGASPTAIRLRDVARALQRECMAEDPRQSTVDAVVENFRRVLKVVRGRGAWWVEYGPGDEDDLVVVSLYRQSSGGESYRVGLRLCIRTLAEVAEDSWSLDSGGVGAFLEELSADDAWKAFVEGTVVSVDVIDEDV